MNARCLDSFLQNLILFLNKVDINKYNNKILNKNFTYNMFLFKLRNLKNIKYFFMSFMQ